MKNIKIRFKELISRLTGFSIPVFGISWQPDESEILIARRVLNSLEDRRVLYSPYEFEMPDHCIHSILDIRRLLTDEMNKLSQNSGLYKDLLFLRSACRKFLDPINSTRNSSRYNNISSIDSWIFISALGELRGIFGIIISKISISYGIDIVGDLVKIVPIEVNDNLETDQEFYY